MSKASDRQFLVLMGVVVLLLGLQTFRDTFGDDPSALSEVSEAKRLPASLPVVVPKPAAPSASDALLEWNWNCDSKAAIETSTSAGFLRLKGKTCGGLEVSADRLSLINETNGFNASVFAKGKSSYETDLIQLRVGPNRLRVEYMSATGRRIESFLTVISKASAL